MQWDCNLPGRESWDQGPAHTQRGSEQSMRRTGRQAGAAATLGVLQRSATLVRMPPACLKCDTVVLE